MIESTVGTDLPYRVRTDLFSDVERAFLAAMIENVSDRFLIVPKLALSELFRVNKPNENIQYISKMGGKSVDFVLFTRDTFLPVAAIELDNPKQREHAIGSKLIDEICASVGLSVFHILESDNFKAIDWDNIFRSIENSDIRNAIAGDPSEFSPVCPNCGITLVLRFDQDGPIRGQKYYGCLNFPDCGEKIAIEVTE